MKSIIATLVTLMALSISAQANVVELHKYQDWKVKSTIENGKSHYMIDTRDEITNSLWAWGNNADLSKYQVIATPVNMDTDITKLRVQVDDNPVCAVKIEFGNHDSDVNFIYIKDASSCSNYAKNVIDGHKLKVELPTNTGRYVYAEFSLMGITKAVNAMTHYADSRDRGGFKTQSRRGFVEPTRTKY